MVKGAKRPQGSLAHAMPANSLAPNPSALHHDAMDAPAQPNFTVDGNRLRMLTEGPERLSELLALIAGAERTLRVLYYIYVDDAAGTAVREALIAAARRGVKVSLIVDGLGSEHAAARNFFDPLREAGVEMCRFVPRWGRRYLLRNHQKLALADEERVIIGGFNIEDSYFGTARAGRVARPGLARRGAGGGATGRLFRRPVALGQARAAADARADQDARRWSEPAGSRRAGCSAARRGGSVALGAYGEAGHGWRETIDLIAAYFAPNPAMLSRLDKVGKRGRVRCVLPSKLDHTAAIWAARFTYAGLLRKRVQIYEYQPTKLHTKLFVIDDTVHIGSANFDIRSDVPQSRTDAADRACCLRRACPRLCRWRDRQFGTITPTLYKARTGPWTRFKQMIAYFVMAVLDYNVTKGLNFGREGKRG
jgi:cardiolipin synthase